jgi:DNA-binding MarR family transcriptional regulator
MIAEVAIATETKRQEETAMSVRLRPSQALKLWHDVGLDMVRSAEVDLTAIYLEPPPHTVRGLAQKLGVTKPVITRALDAMGDLDLVSRRRDPADRRNVIIQRTVRGSLFLERLADLIIARGEQVAQESPLR